jgi:hypothetical protein
MNEMATIKISATRNDKLLQPNRILAKQLTHIPSASDIFECRWSLNLSSASAEQQHNTQATNWQAVDVNFK